MSHASVFFTFPETIVIRTNLTVHKSAFADFQQKKKLLPQQTANSHFLLTVTIQLNIYDLCLKVIFYNL